MAKKQSVVYIIESPSPKDFLHGRQESGTLKASFKLASVKSVAFTTVNLKTFESAISAIERLVAGGAHYPIIHFSGHGDATGIELTDGTSVDWTKLRGFLQRIATQVGSKLLLCFSACEGWQAVKMGLTSNQAPFEHLVGPKIKLDWSDCCLAYAAFYNLFIRKGVSIEDAVKRMNVAIGHDDKVFFTASGDAARGKFIKRIGAK